MFFCVKQVDTVARNSLENYRFCNKTTEDKVGEQMYLLKISNKYYRVIVNIRYIQYMLNNPTVMN